MMGKGRHMALRTSSRSSRPPAPPPPPVQPHELQIGELRVLVRFIGLIFINAATILLISEYLNQRGAEGLTNWLCTRPSLALLNLGIILSITSVLVFLTNRLDTSCQLSLLLLVFPIASSVKRSMLLEPLWPRDLQLAGHFMQLAPHYINPWQATWGAILIILVLLSVGVVARSLVQLRLGTAARITGGGGVLLLLLPVLAMPAHILARSTPASAPDSATTAVDAAYRTCGFALGFTLAARDQQDVIPPDCSPAAIQAIAQRYPARVTDTLEHPDIIVILAESFWDPSELPGITFSSPPAPTLQALRGGREGQVFRFLTPSFGGKTANVEFELLTGLSMNFLAPGSTPYMGRMGALATPSIPHLLSTLGYHTIAIHAYDRQFYNRDRVYPLLGFDEYHGGETFSANDICGNYISDAAFGRRLIDEIDRSTGPTLLFGASMENHGPYLPNRYGMREITVSGKLPSEELACLATFAEGIRHTDAMIATLTEHLRLRARPTILLVFGDHLNAIVPSNGILRGSGFVTDQNTLQDRLRLHATPALLWANYNLPCRISEPYLSPGLIWSQLLPAMGIHHPFYTGLLNDVRTRLPGLSRNVCVLPGGQPVDRPLAELRILGDYYMLQHDLLIGARHSLNSSLFAPELPPPLKSRIQNPE